MFNKRSRGSNTEPVHRLSRPRSSIATRAIIGVGCLGSIVCILLFQFFVLPSSRVTTLDAAQIAPTNTAPTLDARARTAVCHGDCGDQVSSGKPVDNGVSASAKASVLASKQTTFKGPVPNVKPSRHPDSSEWPNTVALCAMMKTEHSEDVLEWLDYHRWLGVDKVFLRENGDEVPPELVTATQQHVDSGFLDLGIVPGEKHPNQNRWHNRCSQSDLAGAFSWIAYIDLDEFLILMEKGEAAEEPDLKEFLQKHRNAAGLSLQWLLFGSSGHKRRPEPGGPLRHFSTCTGELAYQMKCMASTFHLCSTPMLGDTVHDCAYRYDGKTGRGDLDVDHPVILGDGDPVATHLTTVEAAVRASAAEHKAIFAGKKPITIGPKKVHSKRKPKSITALSTAVAAAAASGHTNNTTGQSSSHSGFVAASGQAQVQASAKAVARSHPSGWQFSNVLSGGGMQGQQQQSVRSLFGLVGDLVSSIPDARMGETVCRSYSGHLNARQHDRHKTVPEEQMLVLAHYVTRSFDDYISRKLPRPSGVYAHTFNRMSRSKAAAKMSNETLFDEFEEEQHFNGQDPVCSSIVRNRYAERCCTGSLEEEQSTGASLDTAGQDSSSDDEEER